MEKNIGKRLYIATVCQDAAKLAREYDLGLELDQFCMAEALEGEPRKQAIDDVEKQLAEAGLLDRLEQKSGCSSFGVRALRAGKMLLHAPFNELFPAAIDPRALELANLRYEQSYKLAAEYRINKMIVHSGYVPFVYFKEYHIERSLEFWSRFMENKPERFSLVIENVLEDEPQMLLDMMERLSARMEAGKDTRRACGAEAAKETLKSCGAEPGKDTRRTCGTEPGKDTRRTCGTEPSKETQRACGTEPAKETLKSCGNVGLCLDVGHAACSSKVPVKTWIEVLGKHIKHVHLHNNRGERDEHGSLNLSGAVMDMEEILMALRENASAETTYTLECIEPRSSLEWLAKKGYL